jgi:predicted amidophosphoribosyltransferase
VGKVHLLDLLLPQRCVVCAAPSAAVCPACVAALPRLAPPLCGRCGAPTAWPVTRCRECQGRIAFTTARAAVAYEEPVRKVVGAWKEHGLRRLAAVAAEVVAEGVEPPAVQLLVPVPADPERRLERGHHPAAALAGELGRRWDLPVEPLLRRARAGPRQRGLPRRARRANVVGAFAAAGRPPSRVALVDDVYTSGATAAAAASCLRQAGAGRVDVVTFARALRGR